MTTEQIVELVMSCLPSFIAICTTVGVVLKVIKQFADLKKQVTDMKCLEDLKAELSAVIKENYELKQTLNETMTKIDHVERK